MDKEIIIGTLILFFIIGGAVLLDTNFKEKRRIQCKELSGKVIEHDGYLLCLDTKNDNLLVLN